MQQNPPVNPCKDLDQHAYVVVSVRDQEQPAEALTNPGLVVFVMRGFCTRCGQIEPIV